MRLLAAIAAFFVASCTIVPKPREIYSADYGDPITQYEAERVARDLVSAATVTRPTLPEIRFDPVEPGWLPGTVGLSGVRPVRYGYRMLAGVGGELWVFLFHDGRLVRARQRRFITGLGVWRWAYVHEERR